FVPREGFSGEAGRARCQSSLGPQHRQPCEEGVPRRHPPRATVSEQFWPTGPYLAVQEFLAAGAFRLRQRFVNHGGWTVLARSRPGPARAATLRCQICLRFASAAIRADTISFPGSWPCTPWPPARAIFAPSPRPFLARRGRRFDLRDGLDAQR